MYHLLLLLFAQLIVTATSQNCSLKHLSEALGYDSGVSTMIAPDYAYVVLKCGDEYHYYRCRNGTIHPLNPSITKCKVSQCAPLEMEHPNITLAYSTELDSETNKYRNGTRVTFNCPESYSILDGNKDAFCVSGAWKALLPEGLEDPTPGLCQRLCDAEKLRKERGYGPYGRKGEQSKYLEKPNKYQWVGNGTTISFTCSKEPGRVLWQKWTCNEGNWEPVRPNYEKCT